MIHTDLIAPIAALMDRHAAERPEQVAFEDRSRRVTYAALRERTAALAGHLQSVGIEPGARVAILLPNSVDWIEACFAILRAGGVAVPISVESTEAEVSYRVQDSGCVGGFAGPAHHERLRCLLPGGALPILSDGQGAPEAELAGQVPRDPQALHAPAFIVYTSGTTGRPKGVVLNLHSMLWVNAACWVPIAGLNHRDRVLSALPLYHSYALNLTVVGILATGASEYLMERFSSSETLELLQGGDFTVLPGVPTIFQYWLQAGQAGNARAVGSLRLCLSAGAILAGSLNRNFEAHFGIKLLDGYGITETSTMVTLNSPTGTRVPGSCGLPVPGLSVRLIDPVSGLDAAPGQEGELVVRGPNLMLGYHNNPAATDAVLRNGWYHTGDLARQDENAFLAITGRLKEIINRGGQNIAPAEVEEAIASHPAVLDCAVVAMPHEALGQVPAAFVVLRDGAELDEAGLHAHCRTLLSAYKVPASLHIVAAIPRTGSGKTMRHKLVEGASPGLG